MERSRISARLIAEINHANPYYDDSYAVNSANLGPYGDAIETELIPAIEKQFRGIGQGWARFVYGGSTGGWESMAVQMFYPDHYNGAFVACPDPVDFRAYTTINLYQDKNAFYMQGAHADMPQPAMRDYLGRTLHHHAGRESIRAGPGIARRVPESNSTSGRRFMVRSGKTVTRSRSSTRKPARSILRWPLIGKSITT